MRSFGVINYTYRIKDFGFKDAVRECLSFLYQFVKEVFLPELKPRISDNLPFLTFMSSREHLFIMNDLVAKSLDYQLNKMYFFNPNFSLRPNSYNLKDQRKKLISPFKKEVRGIFRPAIKEFKLFLNHVGLSKWHAVSFSIHMYRQFSAFYYYKEVFRDKSIPYLLCEYDQYNEIAALILAAKEEGIPTYTQTHGLLNSQFAYTPLVAENIFVWGQYHKKLLNSWGVDEANIYVSGAVQFQQGEDLNLNREALLKSYGLNQRVISLATNPMQSEVQGALIAFVEALVSILPKEWSLVLRPHPSEQIRPYQARLQNIGAQVFDNSQMPIQDLLGLSDIVMVWNSAFAIDALVNKIPTVHIDLKGIESEGEVIRLVAEKLMPSFSHPLALVEYIQKFEGQNAERFCLQEEDYERFNKVYCVATGQEAASNIKKHLSKHIN
ncbi:MAG: hypothetical protein NXI09_14140 [Bacteroidetes bacterium]|nr:hypothetical protein [Bacteroidota bacterium]